MPQVGFLVFFFSIKAESIYSNELHFCLNVGVPADWIHSWKFSNVEGWRLEVKDNREANEGSFCFRLNFLCSMHCTFISLKSKFIGMVLLNT
jgi:hypothetical protein